jgi:23S rRNA (cytosine1962-C5)-methyltransferase
MVAFPTITIRNGADMHLRNRHHAIYRSAIVGTPTASDGAVVRVLAGDGSFLCYATYNSKAYICGRAVAFKEGEPMSQIKAAMQRAVELRSMFFPEGGTNAYRLINAEGDGIPGLVVDKYDRTLVVQFTTLGMDVLRDWVAKTLMDICDCDNIYEKSGGASRKKEGLEANEGWLQGEGPTSIPVVEDGLKFQIELAGSQKTGLFLDQREMRGLVRQHARGRTVLDVCAYVGGFSTAALAGGALTADAVDYDGTALSLARGNVEMNGIDPGKLSTYDEDAFTFLRRVPPPRPYDFIVLDPPAFAKRSSDLEQAKKAYVDLNRMAMQTLPSTGGLLLTCSCSYQVDVPTFQTIVFHAARQAKRFVRILHRHRQALDHPVNIYHPEVDYLKSLLLWVE